MKGMGEEMVISPEAFFVAGIVLFGLSLLMFIVLWLRLGKLNKRYKSMLNGKTGGDYEELLIGIQTQLNEWGNQTAENSRALEAVRELMKSQKARVEMVRYNAFDQGGSEMSFSIAILNDYLDGLVLSGIYGREQTYMYAKTIEKGESKHTLSPEEKKAIQHASAPIIIKSANR
ncbi:MAG: DUF4446 family protein [Gorillibacterium sp.]|nr:DUF4446 family protein [Gorillibacterium sp.]